MYHAGVRPRPLLLVGGLLLGALCVAPRAAGSQPACVAVRQALPGGPTVPDDWPLPTTVREAQQRITDLSRALDRMAVEANRDPRERLITQYGAYTPQELERTRGRIRAEQIVEWMVDPALNLKTVREPAQRALVDAVLKGADPDLTTDKKSGGMTVRARFFLRMVVPHLRHDDAIARKLTSDLLKEVFRPGGVADIHAYKVDDKDTWTKAKNAWEKLLKDR